MNGIWKNTVKSIVCDFKEFAQDEEVTKINKAMVEMTNNFNLGVDEDDVRELLQVEPEELTNEELLELEEEHIAKEQARESPGYKGLRCEQDIDHCILKAYEHNSTCKDLHL
ncbi:hypothetical protein QTO34_001390, partial [Cnephaeus nilssonii]